MPDRLEIETLRPPRNKVDPYLPYYFLQEQEPDEQGNLQTINTIFLTSSECIFRCVMCDLWKNTLTYPVPKGAIPTQIDYALAKLPQANTIKLYNSGNFFDSKAVPVSDYPAIVNRLSSYQKVIVENHPALCGKNCIDFKEQLNGRLEVAVGLESIHPYVLPRLNKQLTLETFQTTVSFLTRHDIGVRTFILLNPPFLTDKNENIEWTIKAMQFAFDCGVNCCSVIPTRSGNGMMEILQAKGEYVSPTIDALEEVFERALALQKGRVFVDTWDIGFLSDCDHCFSARKQRLEQMNHTQKIQPKIDCACHKK